MNPNNKEKLGTKPVPAANRRRKNRHLTIDPVSRRMSRETTIFDALLCFALGLIVSTLTIYFFAK